MKYLPFFLFLPFLTGCLYHEVPHKILIESDPPGARIELNQEYIGDTPFTYTILGGHNHAFSDHLPTYLFHANPVASGQYAQHKLFRSRGEERDQIPKRIFFDLRLHAAAGNDKDVDLHLDLKAHESK